LRLITRKARFITFTPFGDMFVDATEDSHFRGKRIQDAGAPYATCEKSVKPHKLQSFEPQRGCVLQPTIAV